MGQRTELQEGSNEHFHMKHKRSTKNQKITVSGEQEVGGRKNMKRE